MKTTINNSMWASTAAFIRGRVRLIITTVAPELSWRLSTILAVAILSILGFFNSATMAQTNRVTFPASFEKMVMYGDYRRGSGGELAYALSETIAISKTGEKLPAGTVLVLEIYNDGKLTDYFVMEKGESWGLDFTEEERAGDWHFQQFDPGKNVRRAAIAERCMSCHQGGAENDFMFTRGRMQDYLP